MNRNKGIVISLVVALVCVVLIFVLSNKRYVTATKEAEVVVAARYIPAGQEIKEDDVTTVKIAERYAGDLVKKATNSTGSTYYYQETDKPIEIIGKAPAVSLIKGQYIWASSVEQGPPQTKGFKTINIPTDLASSACAIAGEKVDVYLVDKNNMGAYQVRQALYTGATVKYARDQSNNEIDPVSRDQLKGMTGTGNKIPVVIGLMVPPEIADMLVEPASKKAIYLTKSLIN